MTSFDKLLEKLNACPDAKLWALGKSWQEIYTTCFRGDWLLWLFKKINPDNLREITLAKAHCANTVRHLMKDDRSINAVDVAIRFGEGKATREELNIAADAADAAYAASTSSAFYAFYASSASDAASAFYTASAFYAFYATVAAKKKNQLETAKICRKYLPIGIWNIKI